MRFLGSSKAVEWTVHASGLWGGPVLTNPVHPKRDFDVSSTSKQYNTNFSHNGCAPFTPHFYLYKGRQHGFCPNFEPYTSTEPASVEGGLQATKDRVAGYGTYQQCIDVSLGLAISLLTLQSASFHQGPLFISKVSAGHNSGWIFPLGCFCSKCHNRFGVLRGHVACGKRSRILYYYLIIRLFALFLLTWTFKNNKVAQNSAQQ